MSNEDYTQWHPAFCSAIKLELKENKNDLTYHSEYGLNSKPILIDLLVITKSTDVIIANEIGRIFKGHNIFEYKSPEDALNIDTFYKGIAYASLYKANGARVDGIKADDVTISFVREGKPTKLLQMLEDEGMTVVNIAKGIYYVYGVLMYDIQIIVTSELDQAEHIWLRSLTEKMSAQDVRQLVLETSFLSAKDDKEYADSILQVAMSKNTKTFGDIKEGAIVFESLKEFMKDEIEAEKKRAVAEAVAEAVDEVKSEKEAEFATIITEKEAAIASLNEEIIKLKAMIPD